MENFKWLLNKGANVKVTDSDGRSILHSAARYGWCNNKHLLQYVATYFSSLQNIILKRWLCKLDIYFVTKNDCYKENVAY